MMLQKLDSVSAKVYRRFACLLIFIVLGVAPAFAQISYTTKAQQRREQKQFLKEAGKTESTYKETHLNTDAYTFKKGKASRKRVKANASSAQYDFNENGDPGKPVKDFRKKRNKRSKKKSTNQ